MRYVTILLLTMSFFFGKPEPLKKLIPRPYSDVCEEFVASRGLSLVLHSSLDLLPQNIIIPRLLLLLLHSFITAADRRLVLVVPAFQCHQTKLKRHRRLPNKQQTVNHQQSLIRLFPVNGRQTNYMTTICVWRFEMLVPKHQFTFWSFLRYGTD